MPDLGTEHVNDPRLMDIMASSAAPINRACAAGYGLELHALDAHVTNCRAFLRAMVPAEVVRAEIIKAQAVLERMLSALEGC